MKITKQLLREAIKEELEKILAEQSTACGRKLQPMVGRIWRGCPLLKKSFNIGALNSSGMVPLTAKSGHVEFATDKKYHGLVQKELDNLNLKDRKCGKPTLHFVARGEELKMVAIKLQK